ncbi:MAG: nucleotide exchange factor GrpE, partial [Pseudomonadota bacterium]|nr:nucleotide exchange factor GrpE [Pseudomonadota bacterium]
MANSTNDEFLDDIDDLEAEATAQEEADAEYADSPEARIEELEAERDEYKDRFMRALADAENARKRADKDR